MAFGNRMNCGCCGTDDGGGGDPPIDPQCGAFLPCGLTIADITGRDFHLQLFFPKAFGIFDEDGDGSYHVTEVPVTLVYSTYPYHDPISGLDVLRPTWDAPIASAPIWNQCFTDYNPFVYQGGPASDGCYFSVTMGCNLVPTIQLFSDAEGTIQGGPYPGLGTFSYSCGPPISVTFGQPPSIGGIVT